LQVAKSIAILLLVVLSLLTALQMQLYDLITTNYRVQALCGHWAVVCTI